MDLGNYEQDAFYPNLTDRVSGEDGYFVSLPRSKLRLHEAIAAGSIDYGLSVVHVILHLTTFRRRLEADKERKETGYTYDRHSLSFHAF